MPNLGSVSTINVNGNDLSIKDATLTGVVEEIIEVISENNGEVGSRINDLNSRAFDALIKIQSSTIDNELIYSESEIGNIQDGLYKIQYVTITGTAPNTTETLNNSAILIQQNNTQYLYKNGLISSRSKSNNTWGEWTIISNGGSSSGVTSFNGATGAITYTAPVTSVNGATGDVTVDSGVTSFNGATGAVTYTAPVTSVNGATGAVTVNVLPTVTSADNGKILMVVNGTWTLVSPSVLYSGSGVPNNAQGNNGDIYMQI